jgi:photosystem II stability/assembly factor-like uncharacterized protein
MKFLTLFASVLATNILIAQQFPPNNPYPASPAADRFKAAAQRKALQDNSPVKSIAFRNVGPTVQSGRIADIDVNPKDPSVFYAAYASGGLWKTESNGASFTPIFDQEAVMTIGDIAVNWDKNIIWVGTGENISSRSSYSGVGLYKSTDGGKTWQRSGLDETHHIGRIILHPTNPDIVWVAALGHLYSPNKERGIFMTTDGGKTWKNTLFIDENTGCIDLVIDEKDPSVLYTASWTKWRRAWNFDGSGNGSAVFKSVDGGKKWQKMTVDGSGFPTGREVGRIGLALAKRNGKTEVLAVVDNQGLKPEKEDPSVEKPAFKKEDLQAMTKDAFLKYDKKDIANFLRTNRFPEKYKAEDVMEQVKSGKITVQTLYDYLDNGDDGFANAARIKGAELYRSTDDGKSWTRTHEGSIDEMFFTYGYVFSQIRVTPSNPDKLYTLGLHALSSNDGGKTWFKISGDNVHADHHSLWINPNRPGHILNGNDGGLNMSYDDGKSWFKLNAPPVGQFYHINVDMQEPYNIYGGLQDNGVWFGSSKTDPTDVDWQDSGHNPFRRIFGGDGMQTMIDNRDNTTVYTGLQFGVYVRLSTRQPATGRPKSITPRHDLGEKPYRYNWQSPILLSTHNQDVVYFGSNYLHRSFDKGDTWERISEDLTHGRVNGNVPYGTLVAVHESPLKFGLLYTGSDDGYIHVSKDAGTTWKRISDGLPQNLYVSRVQASSHYKATVYASLNGYRWDDFNSYLYVSTNYGDTWTRIGMDLPAEPVNVVKEDPKNPNLIYVGTDHGTYVSLDKGKTFSAFSNGLPATPVHDLVIHPRDRELIIGTHGRSLFVGDVQHLQSLDNQTLAKDLVVFDLKKMRLGGWGMRRSVYTPIEKAKTQVAIYAKTGGQTTLTLKAGKDIILKKMDVSLQQGLNYVDVDMVFDATQTPQYRAWLNEKKEKDAKAIDIVKADDGNFYLQKGKYTVEIEKSGAKVEKELVIEAAEGGGRFFGESIEKD